MKSTCVFNIGVCLGTMILLPVSMAAATVSTRGTASADRSAQLLRDIKADAVQVRSTAAKLEALTAAPDTTWADLDGKWNEMKPIVEDMQMKVVRLDKIQATLSPAERTDVDTSKTLIQEMASRLDDFQALMDKPGVQTNNARLRSYSRSIRTEAGKLNIGAAA